MKLVRALAALTALTLACSVRAQDPHAGFRGIPWGANEADILGRNLGTVVSTNRVYIKQFQESEEGVYLGNPTLLFPTKEIVIDGKRKERLRFILVRDRLCMVLRRPGLQEVFAPARVIDQVDAEYGKASPRKEAPGLKLPYTWGKLDPSREKLETLDWETDKGRVRVACRTWPGGERREVFYVTYASKALIEENKRIQEEERRKAEEERKRREEEERRRAAEEAAKRAAAAGAPPAPAPVPAKPK